MVTFLAVLLLAFADTAAPRVSAYDPLYLYAHFRDTDVTHLRLSYSTSATGWNEVNPQGSFSAGALRDPSVMYVPNADPSLTGTFYFITTPAIGTEVQFLSSTDLINFSPITTLDMAAMVPGATTTWAPEWWHDPRDGNDYFFISLSTDPNGGTSSTAPMAPYLVHFNPVAAAVIGQPIPLQLTGTTQGRTFDYFPYFDGSQYYLIYVDQQPGGTGGNVTQPIAYATAPQLTGPYTQQTANGIDYFGLGTFQAEAPALVRLGDTNCMRMVFDTWVIDASGARDYSPVYRDSCTNAGTIFSQTSLTDGPSPLQIAPSEHGTIIQLTDPKTAALVYQAVVPNASAAPLPVGHPVRIR